MTKLFLKIPMLFLALTLMMTSCQKDSNDVQADIDYEEILNLTTDDVDAEYSELDAEFLISENGLRNACFTMVFPVTIVFEDGSTQEASSLEDLKDILKEWKANATTGEARPQLQFPLEVETSDGEIVTLDSKDDLLAIKKDCVRDKKRREVRRCFDLVYPVTLELPNGQTVEINNKEEMRVFLTRWARTHRGHNARPKVQLPFEVETEDGNILTITSKDDLIAALEDCKG